MVSLPTVDPKATGLNIRRLIEEKGLRVKDVQDYFGFDAPDTIYMWIRGKRTPRVNNLVGLADCLGVTMEEILVLERRH